MFAYNRGEKNLALTPIVTMSGNRFNVMPGQPAFTVASNLCDYFELGAKAGTDHWLEAQIIATEFLFNGRLHLPQNGGSGTIIDNFPKGPAPAGWTKRQRAHGAGYELISTSGITLFGYEVLPGNVCKVTVNLYAEDGGLVAESTRNDFVIYRRPAMIGRGGIRIA